MEEMGRGGDGTNKEVKIFIRERKKE